MHEGNNDNNFENCTSQGVHLHYKYYFHIEKLLHFKLCLLYLAFLMRFEIILQMND